MDAEPAERRHGNRLSRTRRSGCWPAVIGLGWALTFLGLSTPRLDVPGLYYDEVHQAPAALALTGAPHSMAAYSIAGVPVLNMPYSGAIKSGLYGAGLRVFDQPFTVSSWRWLGCVISAVGIFLGCYAVATVLSWKSAMLLGFLLTTDVSLLLATRHDWGPVALALALRLSLFALWLPDWNREAPRTGVSFGLGALLGLAVFEKLSSVVLVLPVLLAFLADPRRRTPRHFAAGLAGGLTGSLPLLAANLHSWITHGALISLTGSPLQTGPRPELWDFLTAYLGLGAGETLTGWILGEPALPGASAVEALSVGLAILLIGASSLAPQRRAPMRRAAGAFAVLYLAVGLAVIALPSTTWVHHWVLGTPLQYIAFVFAMQAIVTGEFRPHLTARALKGLLLSTLTLLLLARVPAVIAVENAIQNGATSPNFDPSTLRLGEFAARQPRDSVFLATEWGVSLPILCLSNGEIPVPEIYWNYQGSEDLIAAVGDAPRFFLVAWQAGGSHQGRTDAILADARRLQEFREVRIGPEAAYWNTVRAWKFERR